MLCSYSMCKFVFQHFPKLFLCSQSAGYASVFIRWNIQQQAAFAHQPHQINMEYFPPLCVPAILLLMIKPAGADQYLLPDTRPVFPPVLLLPGCPDPRLRVEFSGNVPNHLTFAAFESSFCITEFCRNNTPHSSYNILPHFHHHPSGPIY